MEWWEWLRLGALGAGGAAGMYVAYQAALAVWDDVHERVVRGREARITLADLEQQRQLAGVREIRADAAGRYPFEGVPKRQGALRARRGWAGRAWGAGDVDYRNR